MTFKDYSLLKHNTFNLNYLTNTFVSLESEEEVVSFIKSRKLYPKPFIVIGGGSNFVFTGNFPGTVINPTLKGISYKELSSSEVLVTAYSGEKWDDLVAWSINNKLYGLENLSSIPGSVGATPVQNIGAYGSEVKDYIYEVHAISIETAKNQIFTNEECNFGYRDSVFKNKYKGMFIITKVTYKLSSTPIINSNYDRLVDEIKKYGDITPENVRRAVINIRKEKLPDPLEMGNVGSFFKNPVVDNALASILKEEYPGIPSYDAGSGFTKLSAAWLIDQCGWKGKRIGNVGVHDKQPLVLVNYGNATGSEIVQLSKDIQDSILKKFGVAVEHEAEIITI